LFEQISTIHDEREGHRNDEQLVTSTIAARDWRMPKVDQNDVLMTMLHFDKLIRGIERIREQMGRL
jgi:hypothetical protein